jgi:hypothetical protein
MNYELRTRTFSATSSTASDFWVKKKKELEEELDGEQLLRDRFGLLFGSKSASQVFTTHASSKGLGLKLLEHRPEASWLRPEALTA